MRYNRSELHSTANRRYDLPDMTALLTLTGVWTFMTCAFEVSCYDRLTLLLKQSEYGPDAKSLKYI